MAHFPIIEKLGGKEAAFARLQAAGLIKTIHAIRMWKAPGRQTIPGDAARELMRWADERGIAYSASDFDLTAERGEGRAA